MWWWLLTAGLCVVFSTLTLFGHAALVQNSAVYEFEDHEALAFVLGFLIGAGQLTEEEGDTIAALVYQLPVSA